MTSRRGRIDSRQSRHVIARAVRRQEGRKREREVGLCTECIVGDLSGTDMHGARSCLSAGLSGGVLGRFVEGCVCTGGAGVVGCTRLDTVLTSLCSVSLISRRSSRAVARSFSSMSMWALSFMLERPGAGSVLIRDGEGDPHAVIAEVVSVSKSLSTPNVPMMVRHVGLVSDLGESILL